MPRRLRVHVPGACYHVTLRGNHQQDIFFSGDDRRLIGLITERAIGKYGARVHAYCWMSNHIHLLVQVGVEPLGCTMRQIASEFARAMQLKLSTTGHFFERRYHAVLVDVDEYFKELVRYIHLNPVRARLVADPAEYPWSSHRTYVGARTETWVTVDFALSLFGSARARALDAYREFLRAAGAEEWEPPVAEESRDELELDEFAQVAAREDVVPRSRQTLAELIAEACRRFDVRLEELSSEARNPYVSRVRAWIANQAVKRHVASLAAVARAMKRNEATLREAIRRYPAEVE